MAARYSRNVRGSRCNNMKVRHLLVEEAERAESFGAGLYLVEEEERFPGDDGRGVVRCELLSEANGVGGVSKEQTDIRVLLEVHLEVVGKCPAKLAHRVGLANLSGGSDILPSTPLLRSIIHFILWSGRSCRCSASIVSTGRRIRSSVFRTGQGPTFLSG
jgi:hypothetical protein